MQYSYWLFEYSYRNWRGCQTYG